MLRRYFLRMYAAQLRKDEGSNPYGEAVFQTALLIVIPIAGVLSAGIVVTRIGVAASRSDVHILVMTAAAAACIGLAYMIAKRMTAEYREHPEAAADYGTRRDRRIAHVQFVCFLVGSLALPWMTALVLWLF